MKGYRYENRGRVKGGKMRGWLRVWKKEGGLRVGKWRRINLLEKGESYESEKWVELWVGKGVGLWMGKGGVLWVGKGGRVIGRKIGEG